ncbi:hypothetical protein VDGD_00052 [Verticillium dahliae]|nr:hypothetical protein VDGD_00052 [Verticillium dahliae]
MSAMEGDPPPELTITPPLLNSANPWATTLEDLQAIFDSPHTGAITTRTTLLDGFEHDDAVHQYAFFSPTTSLASSSARQRAKGESAPATNPQEHAATVNNLGYSPYPLSKYLAFLKKIHKTVDKKSPQHLKPIIVSVTGTPQEIRRCYDRLDAFQDEVPNLTIAMEINLSCPNIADAPPPAYTAAGLKAYLDVLPAAPDLPVGIKTPPYTYATQFADLLDVLRKSCIVVTRSSLMKIPCRLSFITTCNTLGACLVLGPDGKPALPGDGLGGMAGPPLHPLALGNVRTIARMLKGWPETKHVSVIGVGGVGDAEAYRRMRNAGAYAVAVGTALGKDGVDVFAQIAKGFTDKEK